MKAITKFPAGTFSWIDLVTTDQAAAKSFYGELFGWTGIDNPVQEGVVYTMCQLNGLDTGGISQLSEEMKAQGIPPHWNSYITVDNVDESAAKAKSLGGTVMGEPFDVFDAGRMAVVQDPTGATFMMWQAGQHAGAGVVNAPGSLSWNELVSKDKAKAIAFYTGLFGWETQDADMGNGMIYTSIMNQGRPNGGMMQMTEEWGDLPSHWMVYFAVEDCDASAAKVKSLGGTVMIEPQDIPDVGRFSQVQDPQGAAFTILQMNMAQEPPDEWLK